MGNPLLTAIHGEGGTMNGLIVYNKGTWETKRGINNGRIIRLSLMEAL
jgi:hypothetical protein